MDLKSFEQEFRYLLICLAECRIDLKTWKDWWAVHSAEAKKIISPGDFSRLNCAPCSYGLDTYMVKCQQGAERYLTKMKISFHHSDIYTKGANEEYRLYHENLERKHRTVQEEIQKRYEQRERERKELIDYKIPAHDMNKSDLRILSIHANDLEIIKLLIQWTEFLAGERYAEALSMFQHYNDALNWTPELLESAVYGYGCPGYTREEAEKQFGASDFKITSLLQNSDRNKIITNIDINRYEFEVTKEKAGMWGLSDIDYENILGDIHYDVPLNGEASDLTAIFFLKKLNEQSMTLSFFDLHVM